MQHPIGGMVDVIAGGDQIDVRGVVALKGRAIAMEGVAVDFNDDALGGPEEIDKMVSDEDVDLGHRQSVSTDQGQEVDLGHGTRLDRARVDFGGDAS